MPRGKQECEIKPAKVGSTPQDQEGSNGDNNNHNSGYIEGIKKKISGDPNKNSMQPKGTSTGMTTLDHSSPKGLAQGQLVDLHKDKGWAHLQGSELASALLKPPEEFSLHHLEGLSKGRNTLDHFGDKGQVQGPDPHTDEDWADLQGKERWNFLIYSRSDHPIEVEGIEVKLGWETTKTILQNGNTSKTRSTKKSLQ